MTRLVFLSFGVFWAWSSSVNACPCSVPSAETAWGQSVGVFEGHVLALSAEASGGTAEVAVVQQWKGVESERIVVRWTTMPEPCAVSLVSGRSYLMYLRRHDAQWVLEPCARVIPIQDASPDLVFLGAGVVPVDIDEDEEVEPARERPPVRVGLASCSIRPRTDSAPFGGFLGFILLGCWCYRRRSRSWRSAALAGSVLMATACSGGESVPASELTVGGEVIDDVRSAARVFRDVEETLLESEVLEISASTMMEGAAHEYFAGRLAISAERFALNFVGSSDGDERTPWLRGAEQELVGGGISSNSSAFRMRAPEELRANFIRAWLRLGLGALLTQLAHGEFPDPLAGVTTTLEAASRGDTRAVDGTLVYPLSFSMVSGGRVAGRTTLWFQADNDLPFAREQVIRRGRSVSREYERYMEVRAY